MASPVHYLPILTTVLAVLFALSLYRRWRARRSPHLWWWAFGITTYGLGTAIESAITLTGNTVFLTKIWYIAGALLGGYPLAQGSLYLSWPRPLANRLTVLSLTFVIVAAVLVVLSPVNLAALDPVRPSGAVLGWSWVRLLTPFINLYAVFFLIGGAIRSAWRHYRYRGHKYRAAGNALIAFGAILPGIGGSFAKAGMVEMLYIGECIGLMLIWTGDRVCSKQDVAPPVRGLTTAGGQVLNRRTRLGRVRPFKT
jgi:hypothetical protein